MAISCSHAVLVMLILAISPAVDSLTCYTCQSQASMEDCENKQKETACPSDSSLCVTGVLNCTALMTGGVMKTVYFKGCAATGHKCDIRKEHKPSCPSSPTGWSYSFSNSCCSGNNCNGHSGSRRNTSVMLAVYLFLAIWVIVLMY